MSTPVIVWTAVTGMFAAVIVIRFIMDIAGIFRKRHVRHIFSSGSEREEFYVPGDSLGDDKYLINDED